MAGTQNTRPQSTLSSLLLPHTPPASINSQGSLHTMPNPHVNKKPNSFNNSEPKRIDDRRQREGIASLDFSRFFGPSLAPNFDMPEALGGIHEAVAEQEVQLNAALVRAGLQPPPSPLPPQRIATMPIEAAHHTGSILRPLSQDETMWLVSRALECIAADSDGRSADPARASIAREAFDLIVQLSNDEMVAMMLGPLHPSHPLSLALTQYSLERRKTEQQLYCLLRHFE